MSTSDPNDAPQPPAPNWQRLKDLVADAMELPPAEREAFVNAAADVDDVTRREAIAIVRAESHGGFVHPRVDAFIGLSGPSPSDMAGQRVGRYTLVRLIGEGAMSAVYLARQEGLDRPVALKILRRAALGYDARRRFAREVAAQGRIAHPGVASVIDAGVAREPTSPGDASGIAYIAMEWVDGMPLTDWASAKKLSLHDRLRLTADIAEAVHAAHQRAILHRDLKPANVLVVDNGSYGQPKVLDFGIATILDEAQSEAPTPDRTTAGLLMGTLGYMSPEQARGDAAADLRSDVYALGILLHELLVGRVPVDVRTLSVPSALSRLAEPNVTRDSIGPIAGDTSGGDLHAVLLTALSQEPSRRYASAQSFADDLRRVVNDQTVAARLPTRTYVLRKFAKRNRFALTAAAAVLGAIVIGAGAATFAFYRESIARHQAEASEGKAIAALDRATQQTKRANAARAFVGSLLEAADVTAPSGSASVTLLDAIRAAEPDIAARVGNDPVVEADVRGMLARALRGLNEVDAADAQFVAAIAAARRASDEPDQYSRVTAIELGQERLVMLANDTRLESAQKVLDELRAEMKAVDPAPALAARREFWAITTDMGEAALLQANGDMARSGALYGDVLQRAEAFMAKRGDAGPLSREELSTIQNNAATAFIDAGDPGRAAQVLERVIAYRAERYGPAHPTTLSAMRNRAAALDRQGELDAAVRLAEDVLAKAVAALGPDHSLALAARDTIISVAAQRQAPDELARALKHADDNVAALERTKQAETPEMVLQLANRANLLGHLKRWDESAATYQRALDVGLAALGPEHPYVLSARGNLGNALTSLGKIDEGIAQMQQVLDVRRRLYGDDHRSTLSTRNNLAMVAVEAKDADRAKASVTELAACVEIAERKAYVSFTPTLRRNLGRALWLTGELARADETLRRAYDEGAAVSAAHQQRTASFLADLAADRGRSDDAGRWRKLAEPVAAPSNQSSR
jgi:tetratricopeptide (TPR) repeat protein